MLIRVNEMIKHTFENFVQISTTVWWAWNLRNAVIWIKVHMGGCFFIAKKNYISVNRINKCCIVFVQRLLNFRGWEETCQVFIKTLVVSKK